MNETPDNRELIRRIDVLEERMNTYQEAYAGALSDFGRQMAERETRLVWRIIGAVGVAASVLALMLGFMTFLLGNVAADIDVISTPRSNIFDDPPGMSFEPPVEHNSDKHIEAERLWRETERGGTGPSAGE